MSPARRKQAGRKPVGALHSFAWSSVLNGASARVMLPLKAASELNKREHWTKSSGRHQLQKAATRGYMRHALGSGGVVYPSVTLTRLGPQLLDSDNLAGSCKYIRDELARWMGVDDGPSGPVTWSYEQQKSDAYGVLVELRR